MDEIPNKLYRFAPFSATLLKWLSQGVVNFSDSTKFNDPFDCHADVINDLDQTELEELIRVMIGNSYREKGMSAKFRVEKVILALRSNENGDPVEKMVKKVTELLKQKFERYGVLCLSSSLFNPLMWAHYAASHQGICLEYDRWDALPLPGSISLQAVNYKRSKEIKTRWLHEWFVKKAGRRASDVERAYFFTKSKEWGYEEEWRAVSSEQGFENGRSDLKGVYFGYRCPPEVQVTIARMFIGETYPPRLFRMKYDRITGLTEEPVDTLTLANENFTCGSLQERWAHLCKVFSLPLTEP